RELGRRAGPAADQAAVRLALRLVPLLRDFGPVVRRPVRLPPALHALAHMDQRSQVAARTAVGAHHVPEVRALRRPARALVDPDLHAGERDARRLHRRLERHAARRQALTHRESADYLSALSYLF